MDISAILEAAVHANDVAANSAHHLGDMVSNLSAVSGINSDCCSSNNYPTPQQ